MIGVFDEVELLTLLISLVAFYFTYKAYSQSSSEDSSKKLWFGFLWVGGFILLNRFFTNFEGLMLQDLFNFLEHLSMGIASLITFSLIWKANKGAVANDN